MNNMSIAKKVHIPLVATISIGFLIILINFFSSISTIKDEVYTTQSDILNDYFTAALESKESVCITNALNIANNYHVVNALKTADREVAIDGLNTLSKSYKDNTDFKNIKVHVHDANAHSFLRAWKPTKFGDDLSGFRQTVNEVKKSHKAIVAVELGRAGLVLRGLAPVMDGSEYLGSVEFMQGLNSIVKGGKKHNIDVAIYLKNEYLKVATLMGDAPKLQDYTLAVNESVVSKDFTANLG
ncbi:MAG: cache domain-containing protein, partial [Campylobacterota bacterium]|nr:cache domain-containing protein [Campylobacterota bacterium]